MKYHFISGLPRSGSTLLSSILYQNPRYWAGVTGPLALLVNTTVKAMSEGEWAARFTDETRARILRGIFDAFYAQVPAVTVHNPDCGEVDTCFDTNRSWTGRASLLATLYPDSKIICCVREVGWILDSFERMLNKNPLRASKVLSVDANASVFSRATALTDSEKGRIGLPWSTLREAWSGDQAGRLVIVDYNKLVTQPEHVLDRLYDALGEPRYKHDFEHVEVRQDYSDYDDYLGLPGLHDVRPRVAAPDRELSIPPELFAEMAALNFWADPNENKRGAVII